MFVSRLKTSVDGKACKTQYLTDIPHKILEEAQQTASKPKTKTAPQPTST
jgi:hypothetical protein